MIISRSHARLPQAGGAARLPHDKQTDVVHYPQCSCAAIVGFAVVVIRFAEDEHIKNLVFDIAAGLRPCNFVKQSCGVRQHVRPATRLM